MLQFTTIHHNTSQEKSIRPNNSTVITQDEPTRVPREQENPQSEESPFSSQQSAGTMISMPVTDQGLSGSLSSNTLSFAKQSRFLRKICAMLVSLIFWTFLALDDADERLEVLYFIACCFLMYILFEDVVFCLRQELNISDFEELLFDLLDVFFALCFMIAILCHKNQKLSKCLLIGSSCFYLILTCLYIKHSNKKKNIIRKLICTIQILFITGKLLKYLSLSWTWAFLPLGLGLICQQIYGLYTVLKALIYYCRRVRGCEFDTLDLLKACLQIVWYLFYCGLNPLVLGISVQLYKQTEYEEDEELMRTFLIMTEYYCSFFFGYTLIFFKFSRNFSVDLSQNLEVSPTSPLKSSLQRKGRSLKPSKKPIMSYFSKISPTYFNKINKEGEEEEGRILISESVDMMEEAACYICETDQPDIILMGCGHGGICKDCVLMSLKKNNGCMECRAPVQSVYQIDRANRSKDTVKACQIYVVAEK